MKVMLLKDWSWYSAGDVADVFEPTAKNWIEVGIAEPVADVRSLSVERAVASDPEKVERAVRKPSVSGKKS